MVTVEYFDKDNNLVETIEAAHTPKTENFYEGLINQIEATQNVKLSRKQYNMYPVKIDPDRITNRVKLYYTNNSDNWFTLVWKTPEIQ